MYSRRTDDGGDQPDAADRHAEVSLRRRLNLIGVLNLVTAGLLLLLPTLALASDEDPEVESALGLLIPLILLFMSIPAGLHVVAGVNCLRRNERVGLGFSIVASCLVLPGAVYVFAASLAWFGTIIVLSIDSLRRSGAR